MGATLTPARLVLTALFLTLDDIEPETVMAHAGLAPARADHLDGLFTAEEVRAIITSTLALTGDPALGLHLGQEIGVEMLDLVGMLVSSAPDLRAVVGMLTHYSPLLSTLVRVELVEDGELARVVLHQSPALLALDSPYVAEVCGAATLCILRRLVDGEVRLRRVCCRHPAPSWVAEYHEVLGYEVEFCFEAGDDSIAFDRALLDLPMRRHAPGLFRRLREQAAARLAALPQPESAAASVQRLIGEQIGRRLIDLPGIAEAMGLTPRTLQRRLQDEDSSFQALYEEARKKYAQTYLSAPNEPDISLLAAQLGYSEPANFYRAFKSWFGLTPADYRRRHRRPEAP